jgi:hypothetical protein
MALPIVLDKSSFQGLNYMDIIELHRYYRVNITPLLVSEILGDLSKEEKEGKKPPKEEVINLSKKLFPYNSYVNMPYENIVESSFNGTFIDSENRPFLIANQSIVTGEKKGLTFKETAEEIAIKRWKVGDFNNLDELSSNLWRKETKIENVIDVFMKHFDHLSDIKVTNTKASNSEKLKELKVKFLERINVEMEPEEVIIRMLNFFKISDDKIISVQERWKNGKFSSFENFAKYSYYCYTVVSMYYIGMNNNLFGERLTNLLDLEYLFYVPFSKVFSSNDKFLISLYEVIEPKNVYFISLASLKNDLIKFQAINSAEEWSQYPPDESTETYKMWDETFNLELSKKLKPTEKDLERAKREFEEILEIAESGKTGKFEGEPDFVVKESFMSINDPCPCGSGKPLGECHMKKE